MNEAGTEILYISDPGDMSEFYWNATCHNWRVTEIIVTVSDWKTPAKADDFKIPTQCNWDVDKFYNFLSQIISCIFEIW